VAGNREPWQQVLHLVAWTHALWKHSGSNEPSRPDALTIIGEARQGKRFRCVEYAQVATHACLAVGMKARVLALKTKDCQRRKSGAGHVLSEVWLPAFNKWALADAQFNLMPTLAGVPLNAVELQEAIAGRRKIVFHNAAGPVRPRLGRRYVHFIGKYLYFFEAEFDQRQVAYAEKFRPGERSSLMLVPLGADKPAVFQRRFPLDYLHYTHSLTDFYQSPQ
jgi:hypothetical protein